MKKKVLLYTERWCPGGIEALLVNILNNLDKDKIDVEILVSQKETNMFDKELTKNNCKVSQILNTIYEDPIKRTLNNLKMFKNKLKEYKVDVIHINLYNAVSLIYAWIAKRIGIKKIIVHAHNTGIDNDKFKIKFLAHSLCKILFRGKNYTYMACSKEASKFCFGNVNSIIFRNGIEVKKYIYNAEKRLEYRKNFEVENKLVIGNIGRFVKQKNHDFLIEIFKCIQKKKKDSILVLVGTGPLKEDIKNKVKNYELEDKVIFLEERNDVNNLMQMMDVFCLPSLSEGLGIVLIEAQASGMPCIISNTVPNDAIITERIKKVSLDSSPEKWAEAIINSTNDIERTDNEKIITERGYNIKQNVQVLQKEYLKL